jgi:hypothetical protein
LLILRESAAAAVWKNLHLRSLLTIANHGTPGNVPQSDAVGAGRQPKASIQAAFKGKYSPALTTFRIQKLSMAFEWNQNRNPYRATSPP